MSLSREARYPNLEPEARFGKGFAWKTWQLLSVAYKAKRTFPLGVPGGETFLRQETACILISQSQVADINDSASPKGAGTPDRDRWDEQPLTLGLELSLGSVGHLAAELDVSSGFLGLFILEAGEARDGSEIF